MRDYDSDYDDYSTDYYESSSDDNRPDPYDVRAEIYQEAELAEEQAADAEEEDEEQRRQEYKNRFLPYRIKPDEEYDTDYTDKEEYDTDYTDKEEYDTEYTSTHEDDDTEYTDEEYDTESTSDDASVAKDEDSDSRYDDDDDDDPAVWTQQPQSACRDQTQTTGVTKKSNIFPTSPVVTTTGCGHPPSVQQSNPTTVRNPTSVTTGSGHPPSVQQSNPTTVRNPTSVRHTSRDSGISSPQQTQAPSSNPYYLMYSWLYGMPQVHPNTNRNTVGPQGTQAPNSYLSYPWYPWYPFYMFYAMPQGYQAPHGGQASHAAHAPRAGQACPQASKAPRQAAQAPLAAARATPNAADHDATKQIGKGYLYHYTDEAGIIGIKSRGVIRKSTDTNRDAVLGEGVYFTDMSPETSDVRLLTNNYGAYLPSRRDKVSWYVRIPSSNLSGTRKQFVGDRLIYVHPDEINLNNVEYKIQKRDSH